MVYIQWQIVNNSKRKEKPMPISAKQLNLCDISSDFEKFYADNENTSPTLIDEFIPFSFYQSYYSHSWLISSKWSNLCKSKDSLKLCI